MRHSCSIAGAYLQAGRSLWPFQRVGARWLAGRRKALLCDQPGLGKTVQAIAALPESAAVLVVGPNMAKVTWADHTEWRGDLMSCMGSGGFRWPVRGEVLIYNYESLPPVEEIKGAPGYPVTLIVDEAHYTKTASAQRTQKVRAIRRAIEHHPESQWWLLTGTPQKKDPEDLWNLLVTADLHTETWGTRGAFDRSYGGWRGRWGTEYPKTPPDPKIPEILRRVMLRRMKDDVLRDLPAKRWEKIEVEIDRETARQADKAIEALRAVGVDLEQATTDAILCKLNGPAFEEVSKARAALAAAKVPHLLEHVAEQEAAYPSDPMLVWSVHKAPLRAVFEDRTKNKSRWELIVGDRFNSASDPRAEKMKALVARFQQGELRGLGITLSKGQTSLTLTRADRAVFVDLMWSPADNGQAEDRIHRIGQTKSVLYTRLVANHALDRRLFELLGQREALTQATIDAAAVLDGGEAA
jgi:SWI/SNF-related matrix-associated actin-dependent regulator 1 of chromatin subfamily A